MAYLADIETIGVWRMGWRMRNGGSSIEGNSEQGSREDGGISATNPKK